MSSEQPTPQYTWTTMELQKFAVDRSLLLSALRFFALVIVGGCLMGAAVIGAAIGDFLPAHYWLDHLANAASFLVGAEFAWSGLRGVRKAGAAYLDAATALDEESPAETVEP